MTESSYDRDCTRCPRLAGFLRQTRRQFPDYWAQPVPSFGDPQARILIVGLAPGMHGANRSGRPFTGDHAGILLYQSLFAAGLSSASTSTDSADGLRLTGARIANAVKCLPPQNKPLPAEIRTCNTYLARELAELAQVRVFLALGRIAHEALLLARGLPRGRYAFGHGAEHRLSEAQVLLDSYHCSRYNTQTRRLTTPMFRAVMARACELAALPVPAALRAG
jgi:uracil-DNA glycosylase family 4